MPSSHIRNSSSAQEEEEEEPLFFQAMRNGVANSIIWETHDLENLLAAVPTNSIGQQAVSKPKRPLPGDSGIPLSFRENGVRIIDWNFGAHNFGTQMSEDDWVHVQQHGTEAQMLNVPVRTAEEVRTIECIPDLRNLCIRGERHQALPAYMAQPSLTILRAYWMNLTAGSSFANLKELRMEDCHVEGFELGQCQVLQMFQAARCDFSGMGNIVLPNSVNALHLNKAREIASITCGRACRNVIIRDCQDLHAISMEASTTLVDVGLLWLVNLPALSVVSMPRDAPQPSPSIVTKAHDGRIIYRDNAWQAPMESRVPFH